MRAFVVVRKHLSALAQQDQVETAGCAGNMRADRIAVGNLVEPAQRRAIVHANLQHLSGRGSVPILDTDMCTAWARILA
jgi:hypothetical protein